MKRAVISFLAGAAATAVMFLSTVVPAIRSKAQQESAACEAQIRDLQQQIQVSNRAKTSWTKPANAKWDCPTCQVRVSGSARLLDAEQ
jgi:hypothetical protein